MGEDAGLGLLLRWHRNKNFTQRRRDAKFFGASLRFGVRFREKALDGIEAIAIAKTPVKISTLEEYINFDDGTDKRCYISSMNPEVR
ncbi:hypothetical protein NIES25_21850 [Nostoc linckia NIES-25]|nr:hypothetical protein NIES25_21850 [Nostoc linckia NIES-25]